MRFRCLLTLHGRDLDPKEVTRVLGISPGSSGVRGEPCTKRQVPNVAKRELGVWMLATDDHIQSNDPDEHLSWMMSVIDPTHVKQIRSVEQVNLSVLWIMNCDRDEIEFSAEFLSFASSMNAKLSVDVEYWGNEAEKSTHSSEQS